MKWHAGAFVGLRPECMTPEMQAAMRQADAEPDQAFLATLRQQTERKQSTSDAPNSQYYAPSRS
jgi:hypothetical protein